MFIFICGSFIRWLVVINELWCKFYSPIFFGLSDRERRILMSCVTVHVYGVCGQNVGKGPCCVQCTLFFYCSLLCVLQAVFIFICGFILVLRIAGCYG